MFNQEQIKYYKNIKAPVALKQEIKNIEIDKTSSKVIRPAWRYALVSCCLIILTFVSFNAMNLNSHLILKVNNTKLNAEYQKIKMFDSYDLSPMLLRSNDNLEIVIEANHGIEVVDCDGKVEVDNHQINWELPLNNSLDEKYHLTLFYNDVNYLVSLKYQTKDNTYQMSVSPLNQGEKE